MKAVKMVVVILAVASFVVGAWGLALAQEAQRPARGGERMPGMRMMEPEQMREQVATRLKLQLRVTDEEWAKLEPKIREVNRIHQEIRTRERALAWAALTAGMEGRMETMEEGRSSAGRLQTESGAKLREAARALRDVVAQEKPSDEDVSAKLSAYREAKSAVQKEIGTLNEQLTAAQNDLKTGLSLRQEAVLVLDGLLP